MQVKRLLHSTILAHTGAGIIIFDPYLIKSYTQSCGSVPKADYIFITHGHYDHFSPDDIALLVKPGTKIICPGHLTGKCRQLAPVVSAIPGLKIKTIPAYNLDKPFHKPQDGGVGYVVSCGETLYVAGDTDCIPQVMAVKCDICALPVGGTYTMDALQAARAAASIMPRIAIPTHYGDIPSVAGTESAERFACLLPAGIRCEIFPGL